TLGRKPLPPRAGVRIRQETPPAGGCWRGAGNRRRTDRGAGKSCSLFCQENRATEIRSCDRPLAVHEETMPLPPIRVLLIEDNPGDVALARRALAGPG